MGNRLLIDAAFPEETRVAVLNEKNILENVDVEASSVKQLKGNVYLAKIIRLEPSLQAAFINYGGDRHGFLPMSDIHPDYYNIPEDHRGDLRAVRFFSSGKSDQTEEFEGGDAVSEDDFADENLVRLDGSGEPIMAVYNSESAENFGNPEITDSDDENLETAINSEDQYVGQNISSGAEEIADEETEHGRNSDFRKYKIENVMREGQTLLVQVLKEERGNKGVALTTYISLAGKYSVLMANTEGKGGISRKIINIRDRKILKNILNTLNSENERSLIIRTAGIGRRPEDISRDYAYLIGLWDAIKNVSLNSESPMFIHSEDDILKRTIRDLYSDRVSEIIVEGASAYKNIKSLIKTIMPSENIVVQHYGEKTPLFHRFRVEEQIEQLYNNRVDLASGGSIVIDQTEALVAIDVNSGKSTRERSIEETALATNIEAAREIARQLRLRNIGGLLVVDFIDMHESKNRRTIERVLREETALDRAKTQIDRISIFGLLEISRQRVQAGIYESVNEKCPKCDGHGTIRSRYMIANNILRSVKVASKDRFVRVVEVSAASSVVNFILNYRRRELMDIEKNYGITVVITANDDINGVFDLKKRSSLTDQERANSHPTQNIGKVNRTFEDEIFYGAADTPHFSDDCYYDKNNDKNNDKKYGQNTNSNSRNIVAKEKNSKMTREKSHSGSFSYRAKNSGQSPERKPLSRESGQKSSGGLLSKIKNLFGFGRR
ncbi:MAG: Rne/Rng family ribonuclease [Rickettsiales bacterium]|nr:Rne/Rng family ribonuclease [Rickettsiales bacterium]